MNVWRDVDNTWPTLHGTGGKWRFGLTLWKTGGEINFGKYMFRWRYK